MERISRASPKETTFSSPKGSMNWKVGAGMDTSPIGPINNQIKRGQLMFPTGRHPDLSYVPQWWFCIKRGSKVITNPAVKSIENIEVGDKVLTHKGNFKSVLAKSERGVDEKIYRIKCSGGLGINGVTDNHLVFVSSGNDIYEKPIRELKEGEYLIFPRNKTIKKSKELDEELAEILGFYLAEGIIEKNSKYRSKKIFGKFDLVTCKICNKKFRRLDGHLKSIHKISVKEYQQKFDGAQYFSDGLRKKIKETLEKRSNKKRGKYKEKVGFILGSQDKKILQKIKNFCKKYNLSYGIYDRRNSRSPQNSIHVKVNSEELAQKCKKYCGQLSSEKKLSSELFFAPFEIQEKFLQSYLEGDGYFDGKSWDVVSRSEQLIFQLIFLLTRLGYKFNFSIKIQDNKNFYRINGIRKDSRTKRFAIKSDSVLRKILKIDTENYKGKVYDLQIENDESYNVLGCAVHNSPLLSWINYYLPWDRSTLYQWIRFYSIFHPFVGTAVDFHCDLPLSRFSIKGVLDSEIRNFYEDFIEEFNLSSFMHKILKEYYKMGEVFAYIQWDKNLGVFTSGTPLMPEFVEVIGHPILGRGERDYLYFLIPDQSLIDFINSPEAEIGEMRRKIPQDVVNAVKEGRNIRIDPFNLLVLMRKEHDYNLRGTSIVLRALPELIYETKLREAMYSIANSYVYPREIWKLGDVNHEPTQAKLDEFKDLIRSSYNQPQFQLISHFAVDYSIVSAVGKYPNLSPEFDWIEKRILSAMGINKAILTGEGGAYATASISARCLLMKYIRVRSELEDIIKRKIFLPMALEHQMFETRESELSHGIRRPLKERKPILPDFDWEYKSHLLDDASFKEILLRLRTAGELPMKLLCDSLNIPYDYVKSWLEKERGSVFDPAVKEYHTKEMADLLQKNLPKGPGEKKIPERTQFKPEFHKPKEESSKENERIFDVSSSKLRDLDLETAQKEKDNFDFGSQEKTDKIAGLFSSDDSLKRFKDLKEKELGTIKKIQGQNHDDNLKEDKEDSRRQDEKNGKKR